MMSTDYIVASLPALAFGEAPSISEEAFAELVGGRCEKELARWAELETELRNAMAAARGGAKFAREAKGCSIYWRNRVSDCFQEKDILKRDELLDRVWWDAAGELTPSASPLGAGALATYAVRLKIARKRAAISRDGGAAAFDKSLPDTSISQFQSKETI